MVVIVWVAMVSSEDLEQGGGFLSQKGQLNEWMAYGNRHYTIQPSISDRLHKQNKRSGL